MDLWVGGKGVLKTRTDVAPVDTGDPGGIPVVGNSGEGLGKQEFPGSGGWGCPRLHRILKTPAKNGEDRERAIGEKEVPEGLKPNDDKFNRVFALKSTSFRIDGERATGRKGGKEFLIGLHYPQGGFETGWKAGKFARAPVSNPQNNHTGRKPVLVPPQGIGFCVEIKINAEIDMRNDGSTQIRGRIFCGMNLF